MRFKDYEFESNYYLSHPRHTNNLMKPVKMIHILSLISLAVIPCVTADRNSMIKDTNCTTPYEKPGICINIRSCLSLFDLLINFSNDTEVVKFLRSSKCGGSGEVCCPIITSSGICGETTVFQDNRVVGGKEAKLGAWPWIAVLGYRTNNSISWGGCAGSLINNRYVLTAAHCRRSTLIKVRLGEHNLHSVFDGASPVDFNIEKIIVHYSYNKNTRPLNDIALIRLDKNVVFSDKIKPVCLPEAVALRSSVFNGMSPFVIGWGDTRYGGNSSDVLRQVQVTVIEHDICSEAYGTLSVVITKNQICAGEMKGGKDSCKGDSGGPLLLPKNGIYYQIGITSAGHGCAKPGFPGIYTRVTSYLEWINDIIE